jgi:glycosyltransferase involved in cell wall biosynthesis
LTKLGHTVDLVFLRDTGREKYSTTVTYRCLHSPLVNKRLAGKFFRAITRHYASERGSDATVDLDLIYKFERTRQRYDVMLYFDQQAAFFARYGQRRSHDKYVVYIFETSLKRSEGIIPHFVERRALRHASAIITDAELVKKVLTLNGYRNVFTLYPGLNILSAVPPFAERNNVVISVTMWDKGRKPEVLLEIAKCLKMGKIIIAGNWADPDYLKSFKDSVNDRSLSDKVEVTGQISESDLQMLYRTCKVAIRFGYNEMGPGMGSLEAISHGIPLIINSGIGIKEVLSDNKNCIIVDEQNPQAVAERIEELFKNQLLWDKLSENEKELAKNLSWENHGLQLQKILLDVVEGHSTA